MTPHEGTNIVLALSTIVLSAIGHYLHGVDMVLTVCIKIAPIFTALIYMLINLEKIVSGWNYLKSLFTRKS